IISQLPDDTAKYDLLNQEVMSRIQNELLAYDNKPTEKQLWEAIAGHCSPEWLAAWTGFLEAEAQWKHLNSPEEISLGLIGDALNSYETGIARDLYNASLVKFTFKNEELIQDAYIGGLLKVLWKQTRMLERSEEITGTVQTATNALTDMDSISDGFGKASRKAVPKSSFGGKNASPLSTLFNKLQKWGVLAQKKGAPVRPGPAPS
ncbi:MAG: hypothetical protein V1721_07675, partial [Pseudomonadota bacterium]